MKKRFFLEGTARVAVAADPVHSWRGMRASMYATATCDGNHIGNCHAGGLVGLPYVLKYCRRLVIKDYRKYLSNLCTFTQKQCFYFHTVTDFFLASTRNNRQITAEKSVRNQK